MALAWARVRNDCLLADMPEVCGWWAPADRPLRNLCIPRHGRRRCGLSRDLRPSDVALCEETGRNLSDRPSDAALCEETGGEGKSANGSDDDAGLGEVAGGRVAQLAVGSVDQQR